MARPGVKFNMITDVVWNMAPCTLVDTKYWKKFVVSSLSLSLFLRSRGVRITMGFDVFTVTNINSRFK